MNENEAMLGLVKDGRFQRLQPKGGGTNSARLTRIAMQAAQSPESAEIALAEYEGRAILVRGRYSGEWIYSAELVDKAGAILTMVVQKVFG